MDYQVRIQKTLSKLKGFSFSLFGVSWKPSAQEIELVAPLITYLENKRAIFDFRDEDYRVIGHGVAEYPHFKASVFDIRSRLEKTMEQVDRDSDFFKLLRRMDQACVRFLQHDDEFENWKYEMAKISPGEEDFEVNSQKISSIYLSAVDFRRSFLINIFQLSTAYNVELDSQHERYLLELVKKIGSLSEISDV